MSIHFRYFRFFLLFLLGSCAIAAAKITIEAPLFEGGAGKDFFIECAKEYEKARPDVNVDMELDPRIVDKVRVRVLEKSWFELTNPPSMNFWPLIRNGDVLVLDKYLDQPNWEGDAKWRDSFLPGTLSGYEDEAGHIYGIPLADYGQFIWFNKKIFREHGWKPALTWDELFALCAKIKAAGIAPMAFQGRYPYYLEPLYNAAYYHLAGPQMWIDRARVLPGTFSCQEDVDSIALVQKLAVNYFQQGFLGMSHTESQLQFFLGRAAMIPCGAWLKSEMLGKIPPGFELGCFNIPLPNNSKGDPTAINVQVEPFVVMAHCKHPDEAVDFLRFMTSRKMSGMFAKMQDIPVAIKGANEGNLSHDLDDLVELVNKAKTSYGKIPGEGYPELDQIEGDEMNEAMTGAQTPRQIADEFERKARDVVNAAEHPERIRMNYRWQPGVLLGVLALGVIYYLVSLGKKLGQRATKPQYVGMQKLSLANLLIFVGPSVLIYSAFVIVPSLRAFSWSAHQWNGLTDMTTMPYVGLRNFRRLLFESDAFWIALKNNLFLMFVVPAFVVPLSLFLAAAISRGVWGSKTFRVVFFFPNLIGGVAATLLWLQIYNPQGGLINNALVDLGRALSFIGLHAPGHWLEAFAGFPWLDTKHLYWSLIPISIWGACGFNMILYLAGMESISESYYEAARIDGASQWRQFWTITIPLIWEMIAISLVFLIIGGMKAFDVIWLLTNQMPSTDNHVVATLMVQDMFTEFKVGQATAIAVLLFLMVFVCSAVTLKMMRQDSVEM
ncbi:MAG TPA: extracellular solute-binding protein [Tepidisphaeraceae bacterium]